MSSIKGELRNQSYRSKGHSPRASRTYYYSSKTDTHSAAIKIRVWNNFNPPNPRAS